MTTSKRSKPRSTGGKKKTEKPRPLGTGEHGCLRDVYNRTHIIACCIHQRYDPAGCPRECEWKSTDDIVLH